MKHYIMLLINVLIKGISKNDFRDLLNLATKESFFTFNNKFYIQVDGVAMGSPLGPILANIFLSHHSENCLNKCPIEFKPSFYRRYNKYNKYNKWIIWICWLISRIYFLYRSEHKLYHWTGKCWLTFIFRCQNLL